MPTTSLRPVRSNPNFFSWILCLVSYNVGIRNFFGEQMHHGMFGGGGGVFVHGGGRQIDLGPDATPECRRDYSQCRAVTKPRPTTFEYVTMGIQTGLETLYFPLLGVLAWFGVFLFQHGTIVSWVMRANPASRGLEKRLFNIAENLSIAVGKPMPRLEVIESDALNAFASGLTADDATITVTRGLLDKLTDAELEAVLAHEYTHILNGDSRVMLVAAVFIGVFENLFHHFLSGITGAHEKDPVRAASQLPARIFYGLIFFAPLCLSLALCWVPSLIGRARLSRSREFLADAGAVEMTKDADALVAALLKIERSETLLAIPGTMQAMMIFGDPEGLFATHPSVESRVAALRVYAGAQAPAKRVRLASAAPVPGGQQQPAFGRRSTPPRAIGTRPFGTR